MTSALMSATLASFSEYCARCDGRMVVTQDAVGRDRLRCPKCDGVSKRAPRRPDDIVMPQALVRATPALPPLAPGQLRCQVCAAPVVGRARLCVGCQRQARSRGAMTLRQSMGDAMRRAHYRPRICRGPCGSLFTPTFEHRFYCEPCSVALPARAGGDRGPRHSLARDPYRPCLRCSRPTLRRRGRPSKDCEACR